MQQNIILDLESVHGTGLEGRITRKDLLKIIESKEQTVNQICNRCTLNNDNQFRQNISKQSDKKSVHVTSGDFEIPVTNIRRAIANNMVRSKQEIPHAWMMMEVDVTDLVDYRDAIKDEFKEKEGFNLTYFAFFVKAVAQALKEFPMMNSVWAGDKIIQKKDINISIAVATDDALFVPVIKNVDEKSIKGIAREIHELCATCYELENYVSEHIEGGTFTVNNTGSFGSVQSMGIINYPQAAISTGGKYCKKTCNYIVVICLLLRDMVNLCLSLDHRVLDGLICGKFLNRVKDILENTNKNDDVSLLTSMGKPINKASFNFYALL